MKNTTKKIFSVVLLVATYFLITALSRASVLNTYHMQILILLCINIILAVSLNLIIGFTGQLTLGHAGFMSTGGYTAAILTLEFQLPFLLSLLLGGIVACILGYLLGIPILRLKGDYLAITTLGFGEIIRVIIVNLDFLGGPRGLAGIPQKTNFTVAYIIMIITVIVIYNIIHSPKGRAFVSIREDEIASEAMGINTTKYKIQSLAIGAFFAGIAGGLYAHYFMYLDPKSFDFLKSFEILTFVVMGGMGSLSGSILSTSILTYLPEVLRVFAEYRMVFYPAVLLILMLFRPQGLLGTKELSLKPLYKVINKLSGKTEPEKKRGAVNAIDES